VELLADYGFAPHLVHPSRCEAIASARLKNDKVDAAILAQLLRAGLLPEAWIAPPPIRQLRALLRHRVALVRLRTRLRNRIHAIVADHGHGRPAGGSWTGPGRAWLASLELPAVSRELVEDDLGVIGAIQGRIDRLDWEIHQRASQPGSGHPWSSYGLTECLQRGAERIGWAGRNPRPRSERDGNWLIGTGMAAAAYPVAFFMRTQRARAHLYADGTAIVATSTQEFGTGTPTVLTQVAADALGVELRDVRVEFGDTSLPASGSPVGSNGAMMISAAVHNAGVAVRDQLIALAVTDPASPLHGADPAGITAAGGRLMLAADPGTGETYAALMGRHRMTDAEAIGDWDPPPVDTPYGLLTFGAQFAKVAVDADLGIIRVRHLAGAFAPGRILNPRTARSQLMGGMLWGMSQALLEGNHMDPARVG
jgi:hypothetical protein